MISDNIRNSYPKYLSRAVTILLMTGAAKTAGAQKQLTRQEIYFVRYYGKYSFSPLWGATLEVENRRFFRSSRNMNWILPRVAVTRSLGSGWTAAAGFSYYLSDNPADARKPVALRVPELRPHEELSYSGKWGRLSLGHRYRLEERFIRHTEADRLRAGYTFRFRMRYQLQLSYPLIARESAAGSLKAKAADEVMLNFGRSVVTNSFDQNRLYLALNYGITDHFQLEAGYLKCFQQRSAPGEYYSRDVARITVYHTLRFYRTTH